MYCSPGKPETMVSSLSVISVLLTLRAWRLGKEWYRCLAKSKKMRDVIRTIICCSYVLCLPALIVHPTCRRLATTGGISLGNDLHGATELGTEPIEPIEHLHRADPVVLGVGPTTSMDLVHGPKAKSNHLQYGPVWPFFDPKTGCRAAVFNEMIIVDNCTCWQQQSGYATSAA